MSLLTKYNDYYLDNNLQDPDNKASKQYLFINHKQKESPNVGQQLIKKRCQMSKKTLYTIIKQDDSLISNMQRTSFSA